MILEQSLFGFGKNNSSPFSCSSKSPLCTKRWGLRCSRPGRGEAEVLEGAEAEPLAEVAPLSLIGLGGTTSHRGPVSIPTEQGEGQGNTRPQEGGLTAAFPGRQSLPWTLQALPTPGKWLPSGRQSACAPLSTCDSRQWLPGQPPNGYLVAPSTVPSSVHNHAEPLLAGQRQAVRVVRFYCPAWGSATGPYWLSSAKLQAGVWPWPFRKGRGAPVPQPKPQSLTWIELLGNNQEDRPIGGEESQPHIWPLPPPHHTIASVTSPIFK